MALYSFTFNIEASTHDEAKKVMIALSTIYKHADNADLQTLATAVEKKPSIIKKAIKFLKSPLASF